MPIVRTRWVRRLLWLAPAISASILLFLFLAFQHKPGWYKPARIDRNDTDARQAIRREVTNRFDDFGRKLVEGKPFEVSISDAAINNLLAELSDVWPDAAERIPHELIEPAVAFESGDVRIGAILNSSTWQFVAGARCSISVAPDSATLGFVVEGVSGGLLPIPRAMIIRVLDRANFRSSRDHVGRGSPAASGSHESRRAEPALQDSRGDAAQTPLPQGGRGRGEGPVISHPDGPVMITPLEDVTSPAQFFNGISIRNDFTWPNGKRRFRIHAVAITDGQIQLRIEPR